MNLHLKLCEDIPKDVTVLAYNMSFEKGVIKRLATLFEEFSEHLLAINENMQDLMIPFQKKWYVTPSHEWKLFYQVCFTITCSRV